MHDLTSSSTVSRRSLAAAPRDLTDPAQGPHAVQRVLRAALDAIARATSSVPLVHRARSASEPFADLGRVLAGGAVPAALVARPRMVVEGRTRRHELELWWVASDDRLGLRDLGRCIGSVAHAVAPGLTISAVPGPVRHARDGRHVDARVRGAWVTIGTAGVADAALLRRAGLPAGASALLLTLDLDRLVLLAKGIDDPSLLDAGDPAIARQMLDLEPFVPPALLRTERPTAPVRRVMLAVG